MKKAVIIAVTGIVLLILSNIYYYRDTFFWQIDTQRNVLKKELLLCSDEIDEFFVKTQTNVMLLLSKQELENFFNNPARYPETLKRLELLYSRYSEYIVELKLYNQDDRCFVLRKGPGNTFINAITKCPSKEVIAHKATIDASANRISLVQPLIVNTNVYGSVEFVMDMDAFFKTVFHSFNLDQYQFQWIVSSTGNVIHSTMPMSIEKSNPSVINQIKQGKPIDLIHNIELNGKSTKVLTVMRPLSFNSGMYWVAFSLPTDLITLSIARNTFILGFISLAVLISIVVIFSVYIKKRSKADKIVKLNQEALKKMIYYLPVGIMLVDNANKIVNVNRAFLKTLDFEDEDLLIGHQAELSLIFSNIQLVSKEKYSDYSFKYVIKNQFNTETILINEKIPYYIEQKRFLVDSYTEIPLSDGQIVNQSSTIKAQTAFIANISHELRTPLNGIIGMTDLLAHSELQKSEADMLSILKRSADTLLSLINDILDFSKIESGKFDIESIPFNIQTEIEQTMQGFLPLANDKKITLTWHIATPLPPDFVGDPMRFRQVLNNLLSNAIKFTMHGKVHLLVSKTRLLNGNPGLLFSVKDTGIGISKDKQRYIFNSFYQADESSTRKFGGTGLGTTISKELVQLMGGEIWVNSPCDLSSDPEAPGSEFCFTLPLKSKRLVKNINTTPIKEASQIKAVIITDDQLQVQTMSRNFAALKIEFRVLSPTQETIDVLRTSSRYHLLVIDNRPDFSGIDFMQELFNHQLHKNYIVLFQSSDNQKSNTNLAKRLGADAYLRKPVKLVVLREFILTHFPNIPPKVLMGQTLLKNYKILVAEDNQLNQRVAQNLFHKIGFNIDLANNGIEAVEKAKRENYDLVFMDIFMPEMDGLEATRAIKMLSNSCPVVALTASNDPGEKQRAFEAGMDDYIGKPARSEDILRMIAKWVQKPQ